MSKVGNHTLKLDKIVGGGQAIGTLEDGRKAFVWGGLPGETVNVRVTKSKSNYVEAVVVDVISASQHRVAPRDPDSFLSTSPWQIMDFETEQIAKNNLIKEAYSLHGLKLPGQTEIYSDGRQYNYRNKVEFSWYGDINPSSGIDTLDLAFFRRSSKQKIKVEQCSLLPDSMIALACEIRDFLQQKGVQAKQLKTLLIRSDQNSNCVWQLYIKQPTCDFMTSDEARQFKSLGGEIIYSDPRSPASRITDRLMAVGTTTLCDSLLGKDFTYPAESFFQINLPVYEKCLVDMKQSIKPDMEAIDMYAGVGSIGLTIGGENCTLIEIDKNAVDEMSRNIMNQDSSARAVLSSSEQAIEYISNEKILIVDPPRAGLHKDVIAQIIQQLPPRIIYLSCNPVTQARDISMLIDKYDIVSHQGYNFFPRTPHIEHLVVLDRKT